MEENINPLKENTNNEVKTSKNNPIDNKEKDQSKLIKKDLNNKKLDVPN